MTDASAPVSTNATAIIVGGWTYFILAGSIQTIWPMFGVANQLLACTALCVGTTIILRESPKKKYALITLLPLLFVGTTTITAAVKLVTGKFLPEALKEATRTQGIVNTVVTTTLLVCVVMIVVGTSLARAFGVVGAAGLVRYRAKIEDPKDAGVMLTTLAVGLACGVGVGIPFIDHATLPDDHERVGEGQSDHLLKRQRTPVRRDDLQGREIDGAARQPGWLARSRHPGGRDDLADMVERPAIVRRLAPISEVSVGSSHG